MLSMLAPVHHSFDLLDAAMMDAFPRLPIHALTRLAPDVPELRDDGDAYALTLAAPGIAPSELKVEALKGDRLTIKGESKEARTGRTRVVDISVAMPDDADVDSASALAADGLLSISLKKVASAAPASIAVSTSSMGAMADDNEDHDNHDDRDSARPYKITLVAAGLAPTDVQITAEARGILTVEGETVRTGARLKRKFRMPRDADTPGARACSVDGILTILVPKKPKAAPKRLVVNATAAADEHEVEDEAPRAAAEASATVGEEAKSMPDAAETDAPPATESAAPATADDEEDSVMV